MTFNVLASNRHWAGVLASIVRANPDVVALQELTADVADRLRDSLRERYPYQALCPGTSFRGSGVFSRCPILEDEVFSLSPRGNVCQHLLLDIRSRRVQLVAVHLMAPALRLLPPRYDSLVRDAEAAALAQRLGQGGSHPIVLVGDFNMTDRSESYRRLTSLLRDAYLTGGAGSGRTFANYRHFGRLPLPRSPVPALLLRIDYVFHSPEIAVRQMFCGDGDGSDHRPVIADLAITRG